MFKQHAILGWLIISLLGVACIGDDFTEDFVQPEVRIVNAIDTIEIGTSYQLEADIFNNVGIKDPSLNLEWTSAQPEIISVTSEGLATALTLGQATLTATTTTSDGVFSQDLNITVGQSTSAAAGADKKVGVIKTTSSYLLEGDFTLEEKDGVLLLSIADNYKASQALPGLFVYLSNNARSISSAKEIAEVTVFSGAHEYEISGAGLEEYKYLLYYCKPFNVKVGDGEIEDKE